MLPTTLTPLAKSLALRSTFRVPSTLVPFSLQVEPEGTRRLSTVVAPMLPRHTLSSAKASGVATVRARIPTSTTARMLLSIVTSFLSGTPDRIGAFERSTPAWYRHRIGGRLEND